MVSAGRTSGVGGRLQFALQALARFQHSLPPVTDEIGRRPGGMRLVVRSRGHARRQTDDGSAPASQRGSGKCGHDALLKNLVPIRITPDRLLPYGAGGTSPA